MTRLFIPAALIAATALTACGGASHSTASHHDSPSAVSTPRPSTQADPQTPTKVEYIVTGTAADGTDLTYREGSKTVYGPGDIDGNRTKVPWQGSVPFVHSAKNFYFISAQLYGSGSLSCKIVVEFPGGGSMTVASGHASGKFSTCSAEAEPTDSSGQHWRQV
ncbi:MAG TPA: hypothetical protein VFI65_06860 [Streptosporangiaceae bacterium]|nr:hypothetical protein [Streptosporangiaceae bacterium]